MTERPGPSPFRTGAPHKPDARPTDKQNRASRTNKEYLMKRTILTGTAIAGALIVGVAIGTSGDDGAPNITAPPATETATTERAAPEPAPAPEPEPAAEVEFDDITAIAMDAVWNSTPASEQDDICLGWLIDESRMLDAFMEGAGEDFDRAQVRDFFDGECL